MLYPPTARKFRCRDKCPDLDQDGSAATVLGSHALGAAHNVSPRNPRGVAQTKNETMRVYCRLGGLRAYSIRHTGAGPMSEKPERDSVVRRRRGFLGNAAALAGGALAAAGEARAAPLPVPPTNREPGRVIDETAYGMPSKYEAHVKRRRTDVLKNRQNLSDWSMTPLQHQPGIITPNGVVFERHHSGTPDIDPKTHRLAIHGMVKTALR